MSESDHTVDIGRVPNVVARHIRDHLREIADESNTIAGEQRYNGLANQIDRKLQNDD